MNNRDFQRPEQISVPRPNSDDPNDSRDELSVRCNQNQFGGGASTISGRVNQGFCESEMQDGRYRNRNEGQSTKRKDSELPIRKVVQIAFAEILGSCLMIYVGCVGGDLGPITFGLGVALAVQTFGHISGPHLNPSITIAALIMEEIELKMAPVYFVAELVGAMLACGLLYVTVIADTLPKDYCVNKLSHISEVQGVFLEMVMTFFLVLAICGIWDKKNANNQNAALKLGIPLIGLFFVGAPYTGSSLNSFRTLGPAIMNGYYDFHWIFWVGPNVGAVIGALVYKFVLLNRNWQE